MSVIVMLEYVYCVKANRVSHVVIFSLVHSCFLSLFVCLLLLLLLLLLSEQTSSGVTATHEHLLHS